MIENSNEIKKYTWTARRFEIKENFNDKFILKKIIINFIIPSVQKVRYNEKRYAKRWYYNWEKRTYSYCRLYFLAEEENHNAIWDLIEKIRENNSNEIIKKGKINEDVIKVFNDFWLERGIALEHTSEMSLIIWRETDSKTDKLYKKSFHHFVETLRMEDDEAIKSFHESIGIGRFR